MVLAAGICLVCPEVGLCFCPQELGDPLSPVQLGGCLNHCQPQCQLWPVLSLWPELQSEASHLDLLGRLFPSTTGPSGAPPPMLVRSK